MYAYMYAYKKIVPYYSCERKGKNGGQKEECDKKKYVFYLFWFGEFIVQRLMHVNVLIITNTHLQRTKRFSTCFQKLESNLLVL